jgi:exodeoxyribonuclease V alpha subunit
MEHERTVSLPELPRDNDNTAYVAVLETYLYDTRQIDQLARRQAQLICRAITDEERRTETLLIVLLALAALRRGAPRADREALLAPLTTATINTATARFRHDRGFDAPWIGEMDKTLPVASAAIGNLLAQPSRGAPVTGSAPSDKGEKWPLLVADPEAIGFSRYYAALSRLESTLLPERLNAALDNPEPVRVAAALRTVFTDRSILPANGRFHFRQIAAAALACRSRFLIISGGPGTGKTSVVIQLLRTLLHAFSDINPERIVLCAPTGRAKARLGESLDAGIDALTGRYGNDGADSAAALRSIERKTLHGLLGMRPDGSFRYSAENRLPYQVVVVDEASMVDVHLFAALLEALDSACRIILVGDMHQLPSVEAGALLGDLTERFYGVEGTATLSPEIDRWIGEAATDIEADYDPVNQPLACTTPEACIKAGVLLDRTIILSRSYRARGAQLADLARAVNRGDIAATFGLLSGESAAAAIIDDCEGTLPVETWLTRHFSGDLFDRIRSLETTTTSKTSITPEQTRLIHRVLSASTILTLAHEGPRGRIAINSLAVNRLHSLWGVTTGQRFFHGLPVVLGVNHHDLDLYNGDLGMIVGSRDGGLKALFPRRTGCIIAAIDRLSDLEIAFALTVHKSQGSEFDDVMLVLPEHATALLSRQIVYTGITRAKASVTILGTRDILEKAIRNREERPGGVRLA